MNDLVDDIIPKDDNTPKVNSWYMDKDGFFYNTKWHKKQSWDLYYKKSQSDNINKWGKDCNIIYGKRVNLCRLMFTKYIDRKFMDKEYNRAKFRCIVDKYGKEDWDKSKYELRNLIMTRKIIRVKEVGREFGYEKDFYSLHDLVQEPRFSKLTNMNVADIADDDKTTIIVPNVGIYSFETIVEEVKGEDFC